MNKADSERLESALDQMGLRSSSAIGDADVVVLNSCVVRQSAEDKVVGVLSNLKSLRQTSPEKIIALMGCMVGPKTETLERRFPHVDVFMRPQQYKPLIDLVGARMDIDTDGCITQLTARPSVTAYIPIIHGCDKFCSFCIIPYRRGREISRTIDDVVSETEALSGRGVKEVTLLGQNVDSYGHDLPGNQDLGTLLRAVDRVDGINRIRFLTSHPNDMSDTILDAVAECEKVCEHVNLPFQAGDDEILNKMRRGYTNSQYRAIVDRIRSRIPNVSLGTDLIVGFCGETDIQFQRTLDMVNDIKFDKVHSAMYSSREGTIAARHLVDDVPLDEKKARLRAIDEAQTEIQTDINSSLARKTFEVLVEEEDNGVGKGRNRNDKLVYVQDASTVTGQVVDVLIDRTSPWSLGGKLVSAA